MRTMRFSALYLLSLREKRALSVTFSRDVTILTARNGFGKSAVIKSLYEAFGATPHKIDSSWSSAGVSTLVDFTIDDHPYRILRSAGRYMIFDDAGKRLLDTASVSNELATFLADLLDFRLLMLNQTRQTVVPPPAYIFAPFYIDQDRSWSTAWQSFDRMYLPNSPKSLSEYHTGIRPNQFYVARAERDRLQAVLNEHSDQRRAIERALNEVRDLVKEGALSYDLEDFAVEVEELVARSAELNRLQTNYRNDLARLENERDLWSEQQDILRASLNEMRETVRLAAEQPSSVECPTCGQHYENSLADQFGLITDFDGLFEAYQAGREKVSSLEAIIAKQRTSLQNVRSKLREVDAVLGQVRAETSLDDVIVARGRTETTLALRRRLGDIDAEIGAALAKLEAAEREMQLITDPKRTERITDYFQRCFAEFTAALDVRATFSTKGMSTSKLPRGSEGPRGLVSYYYAILHTAREFGSSAFCPILVDAPNQQGQDSEHLPAILTFLAERRPPSSQVIIASEESFGLEGEDIDVVGVGVRRNQVLDENSYESVAEVLRPLLGELI
jgi:hypothetical protein